MVSDIKRREFLAGAVGAALLTAVPPRAEAADDILIGVPAAQSSPVGVGDHKDWLNGVTVGGPGHPRTVNVPTTPGVHHVVAHVTFEGSTKPRTVRYTFRVPTPVLHPHHGPSKFTG